MSGLSLVVQSGLAFRTICPYLDWTAGFKNILFCHTHCTLATIFPYYPTTAIIGLTKPSLLFSAIRRLAATRAHRVKVLCMVLVIGTVTPHRLEDDCLTDVQTKILLKPFTSIQEGPPAFIVLKASCKDIYESF